MEDFGSCDNCKAAFTKPNAKFCSKCGTKRLKGAPSRSRSPQPPADAPPRTHSTLPAPVSPASPTPTAPTEKVAKKEISPPIAKPTAPTPPAPPPQQHPDSAATTTSTDDEMRTLDPTDDESSYNIAMSTLGPDGITPDMLQTSNAAELMGYKKGGMLGRGTYGAVYLGLLPDGSFHAVKTVELGGKGGGITAKQLVSLSREITMMKRLRHRNLCTFKGVFYSADDSSINMFMEYIGGGSLTSIVKKFKPLPPMVIRSWTKQLLTGLLYLHTQRVIHRDIKGENILIDTNCDITKEAQVKLVDFGAAKRLTDAVAQSRTVIGTPYWMAPEVVDLTGEGNGYSYKADVWSAGCTVAEMITGRPPWPAKANIPAAILMIAQCQGCPAEMPREAEGASPGCIDFMSKCFVRDPSERPTVEDLLEHPWILGTMA